MRTRCEETGRVLQPVVIRPGADGAGWDDRDTHWLFLRGRDLYEACADATTGSLTGLFKR